MVGRGHGHHRHRSRRHALYALDAGRQGARQADDGAAIQHHGSDRAQRFDMEAQLDGWKFASEGAQHLSQSFRRQHDVNGEIDLRLQPVEQPLHLGAQPVDAVRNAAHFRQQCAAGHGQLRLARAFPVEQRQAQLRLQIGDAIADDRHGAVEPASRRGEAAGVDDGQEDAQLVEGRRAGLVHHSKSWNVSTDFIWLIGKESKP